MYSYFQPKYNLKDLADQDFCESPAKKPSISGDAVAIARGNCTFSEKARLVQDYGGETALIVSEGHLVSCHTIQ